MLRGVSFRCIQTTVKKSDHLRYKTYLDLHKSFSFFQGGIALLFTYIVAKMVY